MAQLEAEEIGKRIALARDLAGLTQPALAEMVDVSTRQLQNWEAGVTIPYKYFRDLSRYLKRPEEWFLYGEPEEPAIEGVALAQVLQRLDELDTKLDRLFPPPDPDDPESRPK